VLLLLRDAKKSRPQGPQRGYAPQRTSDSRRIRAHCATRSRSRRSPWDVCRVDSDDAWAAEPAQDVPLGCGLRTTPSPTNLPPRPQRSMRSRLTTTQRSISCWRYFHQLMVESHGQGVGRCSVTKCLRTHQLCVLEPIPTRSPVRLVPGQLPQPDPKQIPIVHHFWLSKNWPLAIYAVALGSRSTCA